MWWSLAVTALGGFVAYREAGIGGIVTGAYVAFVLDWSVAALTRQRGERRTPMSNLGSPGEQIAGLGVATVTLVTAAQLGWGWGWLGALVGHALGMALGLGSFFRELRDE